jgi:histidinol-phosphate phosphatase family protein
MKQAIILAGGKGTRLKEVLGDLPKPLIDICGMPLLERQLLLLKKYNFDEIIILVNYASEKIIQFCKSKNNWGLNIKIVDDGEPMGTAGAVLKIFNLLSEEFLVVYGDTMLDVNLDMFYKFHNSILKNHITLFLHPNDHPQDSDIIEIDEFGRILKIHGYPHTEKVYLPNLVNAAIYWVKKDSIKKWKFNQHMLDFAKDLFPIMLKEGFYLRGYKSTEYIKDCGTPKRLKKICNDFSSGKISKSNLNIRQKAIFIDRDGTINYEVNHLSDVGQFDLIPNVSLAISKFNKSEYLTCIISNQPVIARGDCTIENLNYIHNKMETLLGLNGAYIDRIYFCPHHPDKGFINENKNYKINCNCRKPLPGMVNKAIKELNIDLGQSWLIGDTTTDIATAKNLDIKSILVETGYAGLDQKYHVLPDFIVPNLESASIFILDIFPKINSFTTKLIDNIKKGDTIIIGGLSRSGKSTFASVLYYALKDCNKRSHIISIDRWLKNEFDRKPGVIGRYDILEFEEFINKINNIKEDTTFFLPAYNKIKREKINNIEKILISKDDIIIIEGTISLGLNITSKNKLHKYYIHLDETYRKKRVLNEYQLRGYNFENASQIYIDRQIDEFPIINKSNNGCTEIDMSQFYKLNES